MLKYIIKRLIWVIPVNLGVISIVFTITYFTPGDPVAQVLGSDITPELYAAKRAEMGLDRPFIVQLGSYLWNAVTKLDLGKSYMTNIPVSSSLAERIPISMRLSLMGMCLMVAFGLPLGITQALKQYSMLDVSLTTLSLILAAIPGYVLALVCLLVFGVMLRWMPITGLDGWKGYILPIFCAAGGGMAVYARMTRATMLEVIRQDYIRTARAKGQAESVIVIRHALRNCLIPLATVFGAQIARIFSGSVVIETIFAIPGMGTYLLQGIQQRDYPVVNGVVCVVSILICTINLLVDVMYSYIDPRIKAEFSSSKKRIKTAKGLSAMQEETK